jgi:hypothetical protein
MPTTSLQGGIVWDKPAFTETPKHDCSQMSLFSNVEEARMISAFRSVQILSLLALVVLAYCASASAQGGTGEITGLVTDPTGAVISGAPVKLSNTATGEMRTTATTPAGTFRFPALQVVGSYTIEVSPTGFKPVRLQNIIVTVGTIITSDVKLELGASNQQVTVEGGGAQLVQTEDSALSQNVDRQVWTNMPLENRNSNEFIGLLPGAEPAVNANLTTDRGPAVNGARSGSGNFMVEGFDNNDQGQGGAGSLGLGAGGSNTTISPDAIEEYRVIEGTPPAEYGKAGGFVTDTVLKSGTNQWHGSLFEYNRVQALAANSWFSNASGEQDHLIRNQFGGSVGGPIVKDKTFFYFTTEFHRLRTSSPLTLNTYTSDFVDFVNSGAFETFQESDPAGICFAMSGAACPAGTLSESATLGPVYQKMAAAQNPVLCTTGAANCTNETAIAQGLYPGVLGGITYPVNIYGTVSVGQGLSLNQARYSTKFDHTLGLNDQLNVAYLYDNADTIEPYAGAGIAFGPTLYNIARAQNAGVTWSHTFSSSILNQARMAYVRHTGNFPGDPRVSGMPSMFTFFDEPLVAFGNPASLPQFFTENEFIYKDDLSVTKGKHNFKGGGEYRRTRNGSSFDNAKYGSVAVQDTEDLLTDANFTNQLEQYLFGGTRFGGIADSQAALNPITGQLPDFYRGYRANELAFYLQDTWRVTPKLTVNMGLRWEYFGPPHNYLPGIDANFYEGTSVTPIATATDNPFFPVNSPYYALFASGVVQQRDHSLWNKDLNNFGPRFGFSWDALGTQKLVLRGGFGINYDRVFNNIFENIRFNPPFFAIGNLGAIGGNGVPITPAQTAALFTYPFTGTSTFAGNGLTPSIRDMNQDLVTPYYEQAHLGFQYQIGKNMVLESNYVGTFGHKLMAVLGRNIFNGQFACPAANAPFTSGPCLNAGFVNGFSNGQLNPAYSNISFRSNCCDSNYHAWQTTLRKRFSNGLQLNANYTFSKAMDDASDTFTDKSADPSTSYPTDSNDVHLAYGPADFNVKHRVVANFVYDLPFAKSNRWIGGWQMSGIVSAQSGANFSVTNSTVDSNQDGQFTDRAVYVGSGNITNSINHNVSPATGYANPSSFAMLNSPDLPCPVTQNMGLWCNTGEMQRNSLVGPGFFNTDLGFAKGFRITEHSSLKFEGNFFNIFNHPNFLPPDNNLNNGTFGKSLSTFTNQQSGGPRITQLAIRFDF